MPFNSIFAWMMKKRMHQIDLFRKYPLEVQSELFEKMIVLSKETEWGSKYNYAKIKSYSDFQLQVPLQEYQDIQPSVDRLMKGEK